jgi:hypothetical protein
MATYPNYNLNTPFLPNISEKSDIWEGFSRWREKCFFV